MMARWKARIDFLFAVIELFSLALTVKALQGKTCQDSLRWKTGVEFLLSVIELLFLSLTVEAL